MASENELRWILSAIGIAMLIAIWWYGSRRTQRGTERPELREIERGSAASPVPPAPARVTAEPADRPRDAADKWGVPPLEALNVHAADAGAGLTGEMGVRSAADPLLDLGEMHADYRAEEHIEHPSILAQESEVSGPQAPAGEANPKVQDAAESVVTLRLCAADQTCWPGDRLLAVLNEHGLDHGRYQVFHRKHSSGRTLFYAASLAEPGTFNLAEMPGVDYRGLSLFAVLPGPVSASQTVEALLVAANGLAKALNAELQDSAGQPLTAAAAASLRHEVGRGRAMSAMS